VDGASEAGRPLPMRSADLGVMRAVGAMRTCDGRTIVNGAMTTKIIIVLGAFPVIAHAVFTGSTMLLGVVLASVLEFVGSWSELLSNGAIVASFLIGVRCSFGVCRRLWPIAA
jgi:uncharacterized membrane protein YraQ (UPF0718 family)